MKISAVLIAGIALLLGGCGGSSNLPEASGKASITAINAIYGSPQVTFLIEERAIGGISYKATSSVSSYDDLDYTFNFEVTYAGATASTRFASQFIDFEKDIYYTVLLSGTLDVPEVTVWETPLRTFADADTVFQARFSHTSDALAGETVDVYFAAEGIAPAVGEAAAVALQFGDISVPLDFETGEYVVTITRSGDPTDILLQSSPATILARSDIIVTPFDGDANDTAPVVVRGLNTSGGATPFFDPNYPATIEFVNAAMEMGSTDVYDDEGLSSQVLANHAYTERTPQMPIDAGEYTFYYTPAGDTSAVLLEGTSTIASGLNFRVTAVGTGGSYATATLPLDRRSVSTTGKLGYSQATNNYEFTDLYAVEAGTSIDEASPRVSRITAQALGQTIGLPAGSYDLYITEFLQKEPLAGPIPFEVELGGVAELLIFDTADPAVLDAQLEIISP